MTRITTFHENFFNFFSTKNRLLKKKEKKIQSVQVCVLSSRIIRHMLVFFGHQLGIFFRTTAYSIPKLKKQIYKLEQNLHHLSLSNFQYSHK